MSSGSASEDFSNLDEEAPIDSIPDSGHIQPVVDDPGDDRTAREISRGFQGRQPPEAPTDREISRGFQGRQQPPDSVTDREISRGF